MHGGSHGTHIVTMNQKPWEQDKHHINQKKRPSSIVPRHLVQCELAVFKFG
jgi:hypothetical protein